MSGIVGFSNLKQNLNTEFYHKILSNMAIKINHRGSNEDGYYFSNSTLLAHKSLFFTNENHAKQPLLFTYHENTYCITYNGQIYNAKELCKELEEKGFTFSTNSDVEVLLKSFICWGYDVVHHLNGVFAFAIWDEAKQELFMVRDHFGIKPFYYTFKDDSFIFASEIKALFEFPGVEAKIKKEGICELFGLGPAHTAGLGIFDNVYELKPAHFAIYNTNGFKQVRYWRLESKPHTDSLGTTCGKIKMLLEDSIKSQLVSDVPLCTFLSGGLDSSIISVYASNYCKENGLPPLQTFSVDYVDNDKNFKKTDFQPNSDNYYIDIMKNKINSNHTSIILDTPELANSLKDAMIARDFPGMADVDSSLLLFCKKVKPYATISLTGECADEIFAGYPWFFREDALHSNTFPWSIAITERQNLLQEDISKKVDLKSYIDYRYNESLQDCSLCDTDDIETANKKKISHLTLNWFMQTLLERSDRMAMYNGFEIRVPFCDYRLAEYVWNIPWSMKALKGREKGLLRYVMKGILPDEIIDRKKSPYPKTWNPTYCKCVKEMLTDIINNPNSPITTLLNKKYIMEILETNGSAFTRPWVGQLMTGPQLMAYLCQVNMWLERYQPKIEL